MIVRFASNTCRVCVHVRVPVFVCLIASLLKVAGFAQEPPGDLAPKSTAVSAPWKPAERYGKFPLSFEPNYGQAAESVRFLSRGPGYTLFFTEKEAVFALQSGAVSPSRAGDNALGKKPLRHRKGWSDSAPQDSVLRVQLIHSNPSAAIAGVNELPGKTNYIRGNDPATWATNVPTYAKLQYTSVFPGIDVVYYGNDRQIEYDFTVGAGADPRQIQLGFSGARKLRVDPQNGDLVVDVASKELRFHKPVAYQNERSSEGAGSTLRRNVEAQYKIDAQNRVSFTLGDYDRNQTLIIDPTLSYSTYLGGAGNDYVTSIALDNSGNAYVIGYTNSTNFPTTTGALQRSCTNGCTGTNVNAFVTKIDPTGSFLIYSTYLGGSGADYANGIALDAAGNAYLAGQTLSADFPTTPGAFQPNCSGTNCPGGDAFVTELNSTGSGLVYSTYLGGIGIDQANAIVLDSSNNAYVTGFTQSTNFPTTPGAYLTSCSCSSHSDVFITELNSTGTVLVYSTYLGGTSNANVGYAITLDSSNNAYVTGYTHATNFPTTPGAFQKVSSADTAAFVTKMNPTGTALVYSTYLGGSSSAKVPCKACAVDIAVDSSGNAYVCGLTAESNFPITAGAFQTMFKSSPQGHDAFVTELNSTGTGLIFSTYVGGSGDDGATGIVLDAAGNIWIKGNTMSTTDFPVTPGAYQTVSGGNFDAYLVELSSNGSSELYGTYLGGSGIEFGGATRMVTLDNQNPPNVYITGYTTSTNFPIIPGAFQAQSAGLNDTFVSKFAPSPNVGLSAGLNFGYQNDGTTSPPQTVTITNTGNTTLSVTSVNITGTNSGDFSQTNNCANVLPQGTCTASVTFTPSLAATETANLSVTDNANGSPQLVSLTGVGLGSGPAVVFSPTSLTFPAQLVGTSSASQPVTLSNIGNSALTITSIAASGDFSQTNNCGSSVAAGSNCVITVTFKPTGPNTRTGSVTVTDNAMGSPQSAPLTGTGTYVILSPSSLNFGTVKVGQSSAPQPATFTNTAKFALTIKSLTITGANATDFTETNTCGSSVAAGASCTISVTFKPTATGARSASVSISDGGGGSPQLVSLSGTGQ